MKKIFKKTLSVILTFNLLLQSYVPFLVSPVYADDSTPSAVTTEVTPTPEVIVTPTESVTPTPEITAEPTPTPTLEITPTVEVTPEITPIPTDILTSDLTPTPSVDVTPTLEVTPTITPEISPETSPNTDSQAPPASDNSQTSPDPAPVTVPDSLIIATQLEQTLAPVPTLSTDKSDYFPTDIAYISGTNFLPNTTYTLHIMSSDMPYVSYKVEVTSDEFGNLSYAYQLDGNYRPNYSIDALDASGAIVASMTFTDSRTVISVKLNNIALVSGGKTVVPGSSVIATEVTVTNDSGSDWQSTGWRINSSSGSYTCINHGNHNNDGTFTESFNITSPSVAGTYNVYMQAYSDDSCGNGSSGSFSYNNGVVVVPNPTWPTGWTTPAICSADPSGDESPSGTDLVGDVTTASAGYSTDSNFRYFRERVAGDPSGSGVFGQYAWVVLFQTGAAVSPYQYLGSVNGKDELVQLWQNTSTGGNLVFSPLLNDPAETKIWEGPGGTFARIVNAGSGFYYVDWAIPKAALPSGIVDGTTKFFATSANENNFNKDHLNCYEPAATGTITITKDAQPDNSQDFAFTTTGTGLSAFSLDDDANGTLSNIKTFTGIAAGTYTVSESATAGWTLGSIVCTDPTQNSTSGLPTAPTATINLAAGENVSCTFTNTLNTGSIKVNKLLDNDGNGSYETVNPAAFNYSFASTGPYAMGTTQSGFTSGSFSLTENTVSGYHLVGWYPGGTNSTQYSCTSLPVGSAYQILPATIAIATGQTTEITICNAKDTGTVIVHKDVQGPNGEDVTDISNYFEVSLDGATGQTISDNITVTYNNVSTGSHTVTESLVDTDYTIYGISNSVGGSGNTAGLTFTVATGTNHVYVTNRQKTGKITVVKDVINSNGGPVSDSHSFTANLHPGTQTSTFAEGSNAVFTVNPGTYTVSENSDSAYTNTGCLTATGMTDIVVESGKEVTITCINQQNLGTLIVKKTVIGGTKTANNFSFKVNGGASTTFESDGQNDLTVNAGTYSVIENSDPDYAVSYSNCSNLNIGLGGAATCTITNTRKTGNLILNKIIFGGGPAVDSNWSFTIKSLDGLTTYGVLTDNGVNNSINLPTGSYKVTESTGVLGYSLTAVGGACSGLSGQNATASVAVGDQTCSFTNTRDTGSVRVNKWTDMNGDGDYNDHDEKSNSKANQLGFRWSLDGGSNKNMGDTLSDIPTTIANTVTHTITEKEVNGYHLVGWSTNGSCAEPNTTSITPSIVKGQTTTITLCNVRDTGTITIVKDAHPESSQQFRFESDLGDFTLVDSHNEESGDEEDHHDEHHYSDSKKFDRVKTGEYDFSEKDTSGWTLTGITCKGGEDIKIHEDKLTIDLNNGENVVCTFHNSRNPIITVDKVTNPSGSEQSFAFTVTSQQKDDNEDHEEDDDHDNYQRGRDEENHDGYDEEDHSVHFNLADETKPKVITTFSEGQITITEGQVPGWETTSINCTGVDHEEDEDSQENHINRFSHSQDENNQNSITFHANFGDEIKCTFTNTAWGNVIVTKYNDKNSNGVRDLDEEEETYTEEVLNGWQINLSGEESQTTGEESEVDGVAEFNKIKPGQYTLSEDLESHPGHWTQTSIHCDDNQYDQRISRGDFSDENSYDLNLTAGQTIRCEIGNHFTDPRLELTKSNNATGNLHAGDAVEYRLKLEVLENDANDIEVIDLLPRGFKYRAGSYQVWKNGINVTGSYTEPTYHSPGTWSLGDNSLGDKYELVYTADIAGDEDPGLYRDLSWAKGTSPLDSDLTILATVPGSDSSYFADSFAGTHVNVVKDQTRSDDYSVEKKVEGQVLGASTDLPATGANELWLLGALLSLYFGLKLVRNTK